MSIIVLSHQGVVTIEIQFAKHLTPCLARILLLNKGKLLFHSYHLLLGVKGPPIKQKLENKVQDDARWLVRAVMKASRCYGNRKRRKMVMRALVAMIKWATLERV